MKPQVLFTVMMILYIQSTAEECGIPQITYIPWHKIRRYVQKYHDAGISPFSSGDSLPVMRCGGCFSLCHSDTHCGIKTQEYVTKLLKFNTSSGGEGLLTLTHLEDTECHCVSIEQYRDSCSIKYPPPIILATVSH